MAYLLGVFENSDEDFLDFLKKESEEIEDSLRPHRRHLNPQIQSNMSLEDFIKEIDTNPDLYSFIHFSGHHSRGFLQFNDTQAITEGGLLSKLNRLENLFCVFLNGCATKDALDYLTNIPVIIVTTQPIYDQIAKEVSVRFYYYIAEEFRNDPNTKLNNVKLIEECFDKAKEDVFTRKNNIYENMTEKLVELRTKLTPDISEEERERINFEIKTLEDSRIDKFRGSGSRSDFDKEYYEIRIKVKTNSLSVSEEELEAYNVTNELDALKNSISEDIALDSFYNLFPSIFSQSIYELCTKEKSLSKKRFIKLKKTFVNLVSFIKCIICSVWWEYYLLNKDSIDTQELSRARELLDEIISQEFRLFHFRPTNASLDPVPSKSINACIEIIEFLPKSFIKQNELFKLFFSDLKGSREIFEKGAQYFSMDIEYEEDENIVRSLTYLSDKLFHQIISTFSFLRKVKLKSIYDISYYNYKYNPNSKVTFLYSQHDHDEMLTIKEPTPSELIDLSALNNFVHSVQLEYIPNDAFNLDLSPFIIDTNAFDKERTNKINYCFLKSYRGDNISFISFAEGSTESGNEEIKRHLSEFRKFIGND